ncbi:MAG TPA: hypothetical protein VFG62_11640 [Rhodopila sp.]|nr:hypothetical protein [Rhodopila sp.]
MPRLEEGRTSKGGEQEMLAIGRALLLNPRFLILDEPSQGLAPVLVQEVMRMVARIKAGGGTAIQLVEQNAFLALQLADRAYVLSDGEVFDCTASELAGDTTRMGRLAGVSHTA